MVCLLAGCGGRENDADDHRNQDTHPSLLPAIHSQAELQRLLKPAMETNAIDAVLGKPLFREKLSGTNEEWTYALTPFPAEDDMRGTYVNGFTVVITNGHLSRWKCIYMAIPDGPSRTIEARVANPGPVNPR